LVGVIENWKKKARSRSVTKFAAASGLVCCDLDRYLSNPSGFISETEWRDAIGKVGTVSVTDVPIPDPPGGPHPGSVFDENVLSGRWRGLPVTEADFSIFTFRIEEFEVRPDPTLGAFAVPFRHPVLEYKRFSALISDLPAALPDLMIRRKMPGFDGRPFLRYHIESGSPEFNREFQVTTANTAFAAKLIGASMSTWLLSARGAFMFKLYERNLLLVWSYLLPAPGLGIIFDTAKSFTDRIPRQIWAEYGTPEKAGPPVSLACPGCKCLQRVPEDTWTTNCPNCGKEIKFSHAVRPTKQCGCCQSGEIGLIPDARSRTTGDHAINAVARRACGSGSTRTWHAAT
jgi:hypothetical protein